MKIWLDDQWDDPAMRDRHPPVGFVGMKDIQKIQALIVRGLVDHVSFDHDLGSLDHTISGYELARFIEAGAFDGSVPQMTWDIHSANPVGRMNISAAMKMAEKFWSRRKYHS